MSTTLTKKSLTIQLTTAVLLLIVGGLLFWLRDSNLFLNAEPTLPAAVATAPKAASPATIQGEPERIDLPSLSLSLPVIDGVYSTRTRSWTLTNDKVQYATITPQPNNLEGNTFLYGHYRRGVFATLHTIKPGAKAIITTSNGHVFTYTFVSSRETNQSDDSVFTYNGPPILTIQTCSGLFFQNRQFFTFTLDKVV